LSVATIIREKTLGKATEYHGSRMVSC